MQTNFYLSRLKYSILIIISVLLVIGAVVAYIGVSQAGFHSRRTPMFLVALVIIVLLVPLALFVSRKKMMIAMRRTPILTIGADGVTDYGTTLATTPDLVPWADIAAISTGYITYSKAAKPEHLLIIELRDAKTYDSRLSKLKLSTLNMTRNMGFTQNTIFSSLVMTSGSDEAVIRAIRLYAPAGVAILNP